MSFVCRPTTRALRTATATITARTTLRLSSPATALPIIIPRPPYALRLRQTHSSPNPQPSRCPSCSLPLPTPIPACTNCWSIYPLSEQLTHHQLFGLPYSPNPFVVDLTTLKRRFREAQSICHPDSWASKGPKKQDIAQALSSRVNDAYQTLLKPLQRAEYILARNHLPMTENDQVDDLLFIAEIMEARETIEEADSSTEIVALMEENDEKMRQTIKDLEMSVEKQDWQSVKAEAIRLRYLEGIARAAKQWLDNY